MSSTLEIDGKNLHSIREAAQVVSYSRDYITRLAREGKIIASHVGRKWFVDIDSLKSYVEMSALEQEVRKKQLSEERKKESQIREAARKQHTLHLKKARKLHVQSVAVASVVLVFGLLTGFAIHQSFNFSILSQPSVGEARNFQLAQTAQTQTVGTESVSEFVGESDNVIKPDLSKVSPTREVLPIGEVKNGVFLLPDNGSTSVESMFSDVVEVRESSDGKQTIVRVDAAGNTVGEEIPFVSIPVEVQEI